MSSLDLHFLTPVEKGYPDRTVNIMSSFSSSLTRLSLAWPYCDTHQHLHRILSRLPILSSLHLDTTFDRVRGFSQPPFSNEPLSIKDLEIKCQNWKRTIEGVLLEYLIKCCPELEKIGLVIKGRFDEDIHTIMDYPRVRTIMAWVR